MTEAPPQESPIRHPFAQLAMSLGFVVLGLGAGAAGIYVGDTDDAPGAALLGILLMLGLVALGVKTVWRSRRRPAGYGKG